MFFLNKYIRQLKKLNVLANKNMRLAAEEWDKDYKTLIAIMMSAQSRDEVTIIIANNFFKKFKNIKSIASAKESEILKSFKSLNYNKTKAKNVLNCSKILVNKYRGKVPKNFEELISLPGVGRKTANVYLAERGEPAIGVDTHLSYVSQYLGWSKNKNPDKIEMDLRQLFPRKKWRIVNRIVVRFGKSYISKKIKNKLLDEIKKID